MTADVLFEILGEADDAYIASAGTKMEVSRKKRYGIAVGIAACLVLGAVGVRYLPALHTQAPFSELIPLSDASKGVTVKYVESPADEINDYFINDMRLIPADEIFHGYDTVIFRGTVAKIQEIEIGFFMEKEYAAIVDLTVEEVYRGNLQSGKTISVYIPSFSWIYCACTEIMDDMQVGMEGIFMPRILDETDVTVRNHATLLKKDLADYELSEQFLFLQGEEGLLCSGYDFRRNAGDTLDEAEVYVRSMLAKE